MIHLFIERQSFSSDLLFRDGTEKEGGHGDGPDAVTRMHPNSNENTAICYTFPTWSFVRRRPLSGRFWQENVGRLRPPSRVNAL
jgi:hypothetical protein